MSYTRHSDYHSNEVVRVGVEKAVGVSRVVSGHYFVFLDILLYNLIFSVKGIPNVTFIKKSPELYVRLPQ